MEFVSGGKTENLVFYSCHLLLCIPVSSLAFLRPLPPISLLYEPTIEVETQGTHLRALPVASNIAQQALLLCLQNIRTLTCS